MNRRILQKIIDNLNSDKPDLSYIRGVLETLIEGLPDNETRAASVPPSDGTVAGELLRTKIQIAELSKDPAEQLDLQAKIKLDTVKKLTKYE